MIIWVNVQKPSVTSHCVQNALLSRERLTLVIQSQQKNGILNTGRLNTACKYKALSTDVITIWIADVHRWGDQSMYSITCCQHHITSIIKALASDECFTEPITLTARIILKVPSHRQYPYIARSYRHTTYHIVSTSVPTHTIHYTYLAQQ